MQRRALHEPLTVLPYDPGEHNPIIPSVLILAGEKKREAATDESDGLNHDQSSFLSA